MPERRRLASFAALLALLVQVAIAAAVPAQAASVIGLPAGSVICHAAEPSSPSRDAPRDRRADECALCPLCLLAIPVAVLASPPVLAPPSRLVSVVAIVAPSLADADRSPSGCAYARGPPAFG